MGAGGGVDCGHHHTDVKIGFVGLLVGTIEDEVLRDPWRFFMGHTSSWIVAAFRLYLPFPCTVVRIVVRVTATESGVSRCRLISLMCLHK